MILADELALLAYADDGSRELGQPSLGYGLAGAVLVELTLAERIDVVDGNVTVLDTRPLGHLILDRVLARIAEDKPRKPKAWVDRLSRGLTEQVLDGLVAAGVLRREHDRVLLVFPRTRYPAPGGVQPAEETASRKRIERAITGDGPVEPRTAALCALVKAVRYDREVFSGLPRDQVRDRLAAVSEGAWAAEATRKALDELQAAVTASVVSSVSSTQSG